MHGYSIHIDDGESGDFKEANAEQDTEVRLLPSLRSMQIKRISYNIGKTYRILVKAYNYAGVSESPVLGVLFATKPLVPPQPRKVVDMSNSTQVTIDMSDFPESSNGGCQIISFNVQMDDGLGSSFTSAVGETYPYLSLQYTA